MNKPVCTVYYPLVFSLSLFAMFTCLIFFYFDYTLPSSTMGTQSC